MPRANKTRPKALLARQKEAKAVELRLQGLTYRQIAAKVGYGNEGTAYQAIQKALAERAKVAGETADQLRAMELERLDLIQSMMIARARRGDTKAAGIALRAMESRRKLLGLDAPQRSEVSGPGGGPIAVQSLSDDDLKAQLQAALDASKGGS